MNRRYSGLSLARQANAHTVLLRMAEDEDRAARIAELKKRHPRLTWAKIAEETGVKERSAIKWQKTGALKPENAEALARLFGVDFDYVWTGPRPDTPGMFVDRRNTPAGPVAVDRVDGELEERITRIEGTLQEILMLLGEARTEQDRISGVQDRISGLLGRQSDVLESIEGATRTLDAAGEKWANRLSTTTRRIFEEAERDVQSREEARDRRAKQRSPQG
jgi:hypothetical protein